MSLTLTEPATILVELALRLMHSRHSFGYLDILSVARDIPGIIRQVSTGRFGQFPPTCSHNPADATNPAPLHKRLEPSGVTWMNLVPVNRSEPESAVIMATGKVQTQRFDGWSSGPTIGRLAAPLPGPAKVEQRDRAEFAAMGWKCGIDPWLSFCF